MGYVFKHRFCVELLGSFLIDLVDLLTLCFFWHVLTHVRTSVCVDVYRNVFIWSLFSHRSSGINFSTFWSCFDDFISSFVFFLQHVLRMLMSFGVPSGINFKIKAIPKIASKIRTPTWKQHPISMSAGFQRGRVARALLKQETTARARNASVRIGLHCFVSNICLEMIFGSVSIEPCSKEMQRINVN